MSIEGQGHFFTIYFPGFVCFVLYLAKISGERLRTIGPLVLLWHSMGLPYNCFVFSKSVQKLGSYSGLNNSKRVPRGCYIREFVTYESKLKRSNYNGCYLIFLQQILVFVYFSSDNQSFHIKQTLYNNKTGF